MVDIRQTRKYASYLTRLGWKVERIEGVNYFIKRLPILGSVLKLQRPGQIDFGTIDKLSRKYRVFQIIVEPPLNSSGIGTHNLMIAHGFGLSKSSFLPTKTLQIDLAQSEETIFKHFKKDARQAIRRPKILSNRRKSKEGSGLYIKSYSTDSEIKKFREAWKNSVKLSRYVPRTKQLISLRKSFPQNDSLFLASHNIFSSIIGGAIFTRSSHDAAYYWQAFTNSEGRTSLSQYSLLYQGILWAKKMGCKVFDFEGIYDARFPNKSWLGFTHFKRSFGGTEVEYPGCYTKLRFPL